jgi:hypothetical protein
VKFHALTQVIQMNRRNTIALRIAAVALLCAFSCSGCAAIFGTSLKADATDSQVVDADTGQPIEGAVVVAHWELHRGSLGGDSLPCGAADVEEAVTDKDGKFHIPGWGPIRTSCDGMRSFSPIFYIFKSGYEPGGASNHPTDPTAMVSNTHSDWNNRQIKLKKFPNPDLTEVGAKSYGAAFGLLNGALESFVVDFPRECNWKKIPNMLRALISERKRFIAAGGHVGSIAQEMVYADQSMQKDAPQCGSPKIFIEGLEQGLDK